jgi:basic membrane lipoprotein Med (substrate-binding protein (PBP1-ABC) superfamily)
MNRLSKLAVMMLLLALAVSACAPPAAPATPTAPAAAEEPTDVPAAPAEPFRVAVVTPSANNDLAFSQSIHDAMVKVQNAMGGPANLEFVISESMFVVDDAGAAIRDYASQGYDLVIAHGSQYGGVLQEIAPDFPNVSFAWGTTVDTFGIDNIFAYEARSEQGGYVNGVIAGALTESGVVGVVGPIETGDAKLYVDGFVAGVQAGNPDAQVNANWIGSFGDVALASEAAQTHVGAGADVMAGTAQMVVGAIGVARENGVLWLGTQASQTSLAPEIVVANQIYDWSGVILEIIDLIDQGVLGGQSFEITLENEGLYMEYNPAFDLPADVRALADETVQGIIDGSIDVLP